jgi:hypothetical protein
MSDSLRDGLYMLNEVEKRTLDALDLLSNQVGATFAAVQTTRPAEEASLARLDALSARVDQIGATLNAMVIALLRQGKIVESVYEQALAAELEKLRPRPVEPPAFEGVSGHPYRGAVPVTSGPTEPQAKCERCYEAVAASKLSHTSSGLVCPVCLVALEG